MARGGVAHGGVRLADRVTGLAVEASGWGGGGVATVFSRRRRKDLDFLCMWMQVIAGCSDFGKAKHRASLTLPSTKADMDKSMEFAY